MLPAALLLVVGLSTFTLFAYRSTVDLLLEARRLEAEQLARQLARDLDDRSLDVGRLRQRLPPWASVRLVDAEGRPLDPDNAFDATQASTVIGEASLQRGDGRRRLRVELDATLLRSRERSLELLQRLSLVVNSAVLLLGVLLVRRLLVPLDRLLVRARDLSAEVEPDGEVTHLVRTFERALDVLAADPLSALPSVLGEALQSGVLLLDAEGRVLALNAKGQEILELDEPPSGLGPARAFADRAELRDVLLRAVDEGEPVQRVECRLALPSGTRELGLTVHPLQRGDGGLRGHLCLFADLTEIERRAAQERMAESLRQLGALTAGLAHEMRNSLAALEGHLTLLGREPSPADVEASLADLRHETDHVRRVLDDFLEFARPGTVRPREVDLAGLLHRVAATPSLAACAVQVDLDAAAARGEAIVVADPQLLERALHNLATNAARASDEQGEVVLRLQRQATEWDVTVLDRGSGMTADLRRRAFDPFVSETPGGIGMGLALTRRIVLLHDGDIELAPREGGGTVARVRLPAGKIVTDRNDSTSR